MALQRKRSLIGIGLVGGLACLGLLILVWKDYGHGALRHFVSPSLDARGTRVAFSYPSDFAISVYVNPEKGRNQHLSSIVDVEMVRKERFGWLPTWLRRLFTRPSQDGLVVGIGPMPHPAAQWPGQWLRDRETHLSTVPGLNGKQIPAAERGFVSKDGKYWTSIGYYREDEAAFAREGRAVCESLRIEDANHHWIGVNVRPKTHSSQRAADLGR
jgi:hypothetical protein